ncbi:MAG: DUF2752 domain-containing protein [Candidatus Aminicenantes bacterium]|nr:MAG: DUF2752 domain-containing protein [Candidatus Aminicenantes bacterium]
MKHNSLPHLVIFIVCFGILAGCLVLTPPEKGSPCVQIGDIPLPGICMFRSVTGFPCPGCGLLRSMVSAMHGDVARSLEYHRLGLVTILYIILQFLFRLGILLFPILGIRFSRFDSFLNRGIILLAVLFGINWILTLIGLF